ncbi:hypothetical protein J6590_002270 [Homalodisca vitripennis]|nr:hypothetical protein J6590_002270 [Homalodisca vitripennis]
MKVQRGKVVRPKELVDIGLLRLSKTQTKETSCCSRPGTGEVQTMLPHKQAHRTTHPPPLETAKDGEMSLWALPAAARSECVGSGEMFVNMEPPNLCSLTAVSNRLAENYK